MKTKMITFILAVFVIVSEGAAQDVADCKTLKDGIVMKDGKAMLIGKDGILTPMEEDMELPNGIKVMKNGEYKLANGTKAKMKNGEIYSKKGEMYILSDQISKLDGVMMKDGKVIQLRDGSLSFIETETELASGEKVSPDGMVTLKNGARIQLRDGEVLSSNGEIIRRKEDIMAMEGVTMRNGKMMKWENNKLVAIDKELALSNGTKITSDGSAILKDGSKMNLKDGEMLNMKNELCIARTDLMTEGVVMRDSKMMMLSKGKLLPMERELTLSNGSVIMPTGMLTGADGNKLSLREGDFVTMGGDLMLIKGANIGSGGIADRTIPADHLILTGGKMMLVKNGEPQALAQDMVMPNGSKVLKHGHVHKKDGTKIILKEGEKVDMNGEVIVDKALADSHEKNHLVMKMGKMVQVKNGKETPMISETLLSDWSKVGVDGTVTKSDGKSFKLKEGERINMDGEMLSKINTGYVGKPNDPTVTTVGNKTTTQGAPTSQNCYTMKGGKMIIVIGTKEVPMTKEKSFGNGSKLMPDGSLTKKDGTKSTLKEGDKLDMLTGEMIK